jgi:FkbM family methyltransferase
MTAGVALSVVIPTRDRRATLERTLGRLATQDPSVSWEVVVVDSGKEEPFPIAEGFDAAPLRVIRSAPLTAAAARNRGAAVAAGRWLVFIDDDILVPPAFLRRHLRALHHHVGCWVTGDIRFVPSVKRTPLGQYIQHVHPVEPVTEVRTRRSFHGGNASLPKEDLERVGGFDEALPANQELDLCERARAALGIRVIEVPGLEVLHDDEFRGDVRSYYGRLRRGVSSEVYLWRKHQHDPLKPALVKRNAPPDLVADGWRGVMVKLAKSFLGRSTMTSLMLACCDVLERRAPSKVLLWPLYRLLMGSCTYAGFRAHCIAHVDPLQRRRLRARAAVQLVRWSSRRFPALPLWSRLERVVWRRPFLVSIEPGYQLYASPETSESHRIPPPDANAFTPVERALTLIRPGANVLDLGAGSGTWSVPAARRVGRMGQVVAVEPSSPALSQLQFNAELNALPQLRAVEQWPTASDRVSGFDLVRIAAARLGETTLDSAVRDLIEERPPVILVEAQARPALVEEFLQKLVAEGWSAERATNAPAFNRPSAVLLRRDATTLDEIPSRS